MPASIIETYRAMAYNNAWSNHRLLTACARLSQEEFEAMRTGFFPSIQQTLNHILIVDWFYVDGLEGGWLGPKAWANRVPCATVADLMREQSKVDGRLLAVCNALTAESLSGYVRINRDTRVQTDRRDRLLLHLFQHQIHHRGQAHAMLEAPASSRRSLTSSTRQPRLPCAPPSSPRSAGRKRPSGETKEPADGAPQGAYVTTFRYFST